MKFQIKNCNGKDLFWCFLFFFSLLIFLWNHAKFIEGIIEIDHAIFRLQLKTRLCICYKKQVNVSEVAPI